MRRKVLIVEDEPDIARLVQTHLEQEVNNGRKVKEKALNTFCGTK